MTFDKWCEGSPLKNVEIARQLKCHANYVGMMRRMERNISLQMADKICQLTGGAVPLESWLVK